MQRTGTNHAWSRVPGQQNAWEPLDFSVSDVVFDRRIDEPQEIDWSTNDVSFSSPMERRDNRNLRNVNDVFFSSPRERRDNRNHRNVLNNRNQNSGFVDQRNARNEDQRLITPRLRLDVVSPSREYVSWLQGLGSPQHPPPALDGIPHNTPVRQDALLALAVQIQDVGPIGSTPSIWEDGNTLSSDPSPVFIPGSSSSPISWENSGINYQENKVTEEPNPNLDAELDAELKEDEELNAIVLKIINY